MSVVLYCAKNYWKCSGTLTFRNRDSTKVLNIASIHRPTPEEAIADFKANINSLREQLQVMEDQLDKSFLELTL